MSSGALTMNRDYGRPGLIPKSLILESETELGKFVTMVETVESLTSR